MIPRTKSEPMSSSTPSAATDGFDLGGLRGYRIIVSADVGQVLNGGGTAECWLYSNTLSRWMKARTSLDVAQNVASVRDLPSEEFETPMGFGRVYFRDASITKDGGALTITYEGVDR